MERKVSLMTNMFSKVTLRKTASRNSKAASDPQPIKKIVMPKKRVIRRSSSSSKSFLSKIGVSVLALFIIVSVTRKLEGGSLTNKGYLNDGEIKKSTSAAVVEKTEIQQDSKCTFRENPARRYYGLANPQNQPDFLKGADYIRGVSPVIIRGNDRDHKLCVDQSEWLGKDYHKKKDRPFSDGTNPSLLALESHAKDVPVFKEIQQNYKSARYIATIGMTNGQCSWKDTEEDIKEFSISREQKPSTVRTVIILLDDNMQTVKQATLMVEIDAYWGKRMKGPQYADNFKQTLKRSIEEFDDARLFIHDGELWVLFRNGKRFGYVQQALNKVHIDDRNQPYVKASETKVLCCGRNMAMMSKPGQLMTLTWIDPMTVMNVDVKDPKQDFKDPKSNNPKKSHIHGTNGFMIPLTSTSEYLGIGHFHRPTNRDTSDYARHGHHYTHTFFTVSAEAPYKLRRLSNEFVFGSQSARKNLKDDADIIQFASGLELIGGEKDGQLLISFGINDCEGATMVLDMKAVQKMLIKVGHGKEVVDLMTREIATV